MTAISNLPDIRPSLLLDFANSGRVDPRIQCTRASSATCFGLDGKLRTVAANVPRIDYDPLTGKCLGLLAEETRTNLATQSMALTGWSKGTNSTLSDGAVAIDGLTPSCRITSSVAAISCVTKAVSVTPGTYIQSIYYRGTSKPAGGTLIRCEEIQADGSKAIKWLAFSDASVIADGKWRRYSVSVTHLAAGTVNAFYAVDATPGVAVDICAAQYEAGGFPTSYIPTQASAVTRAGDYLYMEGPNFSSWYNQGEGSFVIENAVASLVSIVAHMPRFSNQGDPSKYMAVRYGSVIYGADLFVSDGTAQVDSTSFVAAVNTPIKIGVAYKVDDFAFVKDGGTVLTDTSGTVPAVTRLELAAGQTGNIRRFAYYPKRLTNDQIKRLTV